MLLLLVCAGLGLLCSQAGGTGAASREGTGSRWTISVRKNVDHLRAELPALRWMGDKTQAPRCRDETILAGGAKLGNFWNHCNQCLG